MPVYNAERYLRKAVCSILNQTFKDFEFLIVDDGSTDGSLSILQEYAANDRRIRLKSRPNTGWVTALNEMLGVAQGVYIARMDADDIAHSSRLSEQLQFLQQNSRCVCLGTRVETIGPGDEPISYRADITEHEEIDNALMHGNAFAIVHPACCFRAEAIRKVGGYDPTLPIAEDIDIFLKLAEIGQLSNLNAPLLKYRLHAASATHSMKLRGAEFTWKVINSARARRGLPVIQGPSIPEQTGNPMERWGWWALQAGNVGSARKFALQNLVSSPFCVQALKLCLCALRGH